MEFYNINVDKITKSDEENANIIFIEQSEVENIKGLFPRLFLSSREHVSANDNVIEFYKSYYFGNMILPYEVFKQQSNINFLVINNKAYFFLDNIALSSRIVLLLNTELKKQADLPNSFLTILITIANINIRYSRVKVNKYLGKLQKLEDDIILNRERKKYNVLILNMRRELSNERRNAENLLDFLESMELNNTDSQLEMFIRITQQRADRIFDNIKALYEQTIQVKELYQNLLDMDLNNSMNVMTVVSMIFLPLTLITGWYGMNVDLPVFNYKYNFIVPYVISALLVLITALLIKKYNFMKKR